MPTNNKKLAQYLMDDHPGIDNLDVAEEVVESMMTSMRKFLLREEELVLDGVCTIEVKVFKGSEAKRDARSNKIYNVSSRKVLKMSVSDNFKKLINIGRKPSKEI